MIAAVFAAGAIFSAAFSAAQNMQTTAKTPAAVSAIPAPSPPAKLLKVKITPAANFDSELTKFPPSN